MDQGIYKIIGDIALNYRLSLNNICKMLKIPVDEQNKKEVYDKILATALNGEARNLFNYLFNYETINESVESSKISFFKAYTFFRKYLFVKDFGNKEDLNLLLRSLNYIDLKFKKIELRGTDAVLTDEDYLTISKYRLKYCLSKSKVCEILKIKRNRLYRREEALEDSILKQKLNLISEYYLDIRASKKNKYR